MSILQGTLPVGSLDQAITLNVQSSGGSHFETVTDTTPYLHRASPQDVASSMKLKKVVGGTIAWNQFLDGFTYVAGSGAKTFNFSQDVVFTAGHKCLMIGIRTTNTDSVAVYLYQRENNVNVTNNIRFTVGGALQEARIFPIQKNSTGGSTTNGHSWIYMNNFGDTITSLMVIDLTQMFGSTIADYIYSLEQAHAGDGVAWFKSLFGEDYYPYNAGELMSVKTSAHKIVGFNQFDKSKATHGYKILGGGQLYADSNFAISDYIRTVSNSVYYVSPNWIVGLNVIFFYDADKVLIGKMANNTHLYTTPSNCAYVRINMTEEEVDTACINLSSSRNGQYEPYKEYTYPLDDNLTLRGIPKLDSNNELYYDGDTYASDGSVTRKWGYIEFDGSDDENWILYASGQRYSFRYTLPYSTTAFVNMRTNRIEVNTTSENTDNEGRVSCRGTSYVSKYFYIFTPPSVASTLTEFKAWLSANPVQLIYALTQSEYTESADAYTQSQRVGATEEFVDGRTVEIPVGNVSEYKRLIQED